MQTEQVTKTISILRDAHKEVSSTLIDPNYAPLKTRVLSGLENTINQLSTQTGADLPQNNHQVRPLKKIFGKVIDTAAATNTATSEATSAEVIPDVTKTPEQIAKDDLVATGRKLYNEFNDIESDKIIDTYSDLEIRTVAKLAGLPVTEENPKKVDAKFIGQIKEAITQKKELAEKNKTANAGTGTGTGPATT